MLNLCLQRRTGKDSSDEDTLPREKVSPQASYPGSISFWGYSFSSSSLAEKRPEPTISLESSAYEQFLRDNSGYHLTGTLDTLRMHDFTRLRDSSDTYSDHCGGGLYPESLVSSHAHFLSSSILGNTHSTSRSSQLSSVCANEARASVLSLFDASPKDYTVIFTANATGALKLIGESFPFQAGSTYILGEDSHNSVHGIRQFAVTKGANVVYLPSTPTGGFEIQTCRRTLKAYGSRNPSSPPSLFAMTGLSNISNTKNPLSTLAYASSHGFYTLLDAAALAATSPISLSRYSVDSMAVSFYKMFGYPTGVGALVVRKSFLRIIRRPWFSGGTVDVVQVPGRIVTRAEELHEQFEDGTISYLMLRAITQGVRLLSVYLPLLPLRLSTLMIWMCHSLESINHEGTSQPVIRILSRRPQRQIKSRMEESECGSIVSMIFLSRMGELVPNSFVDFASVQQRISLRTGCMCNPGAAAALLGIQEDMSKLYEGVTLKDFERHVHRELGIVRISLGLSSNFTDVWNFVQFVKSMGTPAIVQDWWVVYQKQRGEV